MSNDNSDYLRRLAAFEQAAANFRQIASVLGSVMASLLENGFNRSEALVLVRDVQKQIFEISLNQGNDTSEE